MDSGSCLDMSVFSLNPYFSLFKPIFVLFIAFVFMEEPLLLFPLL